MQLNPSEISELIRARIEKFAPQAEARNEGTVVGLTDGICRVHGLADAMQGEMLEFPGNTFGLALNLERDSVGAVILGEYKHITEGDAVKCTGRILEVQPDRHVQFVSCRRNKQRNDDATQSIRNQRTDPRAHREVRAASRGP